MLEFKVNVNNIRERWKRETPLVSVTVNPNTMASVVGFELK